MSFAKIPTLDFEKLHGKNLKIYTSKSEDGTVVVGIDEETQVMYVLHMEINVEVPIIYNADPLKIPDPPKGPKSFIGRRR